MYRRKQGNDWESSHLAAKITKKFWAKYGDTNESFTTIIETVSYSINIKDKNESSVILKLNLLLLNKFILLVLTPATLRK